MAKIRGRGNNRIFFFISHFTFFFFFFFFFLSLFFLSTHGIKINDQRDQKKMMKIEDAIRYQLNLMHLSFMRLEVIFPRELLLHSLLGT